MKARLPIEPQGDPAQRAQDSAHFDQTHHGGRRILHNSTRLTTEDTESTEGAQREKMSGFAALFGASEFA